MNLSEFKKFRPLFLPIMERRKKQNQHILSIKTIVSLGDFFLINAIFVVLFLIKYKDVDIFNNHTLKYSMVLLNMAYAISLFSCGILLYKRYVRYEKIMELVVRTIVVFGMIFLAGLYFSGFSVFSVSYWVLFFCLAFLIILSWRICFRLTLKAYRRRGGNSKTVIILGAGRIANQVYQSNMTNETYGYRFLGFYDDRAPEDYRVDANLVKGTLKDAEEYIKTGDVDEIICALPSGDDRKAMPIMKYAENHLIRFLIVPDFFRFVARSVSMEFMDNTIPVIFLREEPLRKNYNRALKRAFDIAFSLTFCVTIFPILFIVLGTAIKLTSKGPIFFKQKRTGEDGMEFNCLKFRTMQVNKDADTVQASKGDSRVTKIGAFMRKTNLDEMPQFINVLIGDMSIVGPRPHMLKHTEIYSQLIDKYMVRHYVKPGITGWAQVTGYRGETKELSEMEGRVRQDIWYIENWTFWLDIRIIFKTIGNMIRGEEKAY